MSLELKEMEVNAEMPLEELRIRKQKYEEINEESFKRIKRLNEVLLEKLEKGPHHVPIVTDKTRKLQELILKLSKLIAEKVELAKSVEAKHESLKTLYKKLKDEETSSSNHQIPISEEIELERDKALGLVKILLATLKSSRMQSEENFHKLKYSSDLMFHIMYKAEDNFLKSDDCID